MTMTKGDREELRRLLRARFKVLRADVEAREAELLAELQVQVDKQFAAMDATYDDLMYQLKLAVDEANRKANDIGRELWGREEWGPKYDKAIVLAREIPHPSVQKRREVLHQGRIAINERVKKARLELNRQENELLTELATSALESTEAREFFHRIPSVTELVPSYRIAAITDMGA